MPRQKSYKIGEDIYDIPEKEIPDFLKENPKATEVVSYKIGNDTYDIPTAEEIDFLKENPKAISLKKKEEFKPISIGSETVGEDLQDGGPLQSPSKSADNLPVKKISPKVAEFNKKYGTNYTDAQIQGKEPVEEISTAEAAGRNFIGQTNDLFAAALKVPNYLQRIVATPIMEIAGMNDEEKRKFFQEQENNPLSPDYALNQIANYYKADANKMTAPVRQQFNENVTDLIKKGKYSDAAKKVGVDLAGTLPATLGIAAATSAGVPLTALTPGGGLVFGSQNYQDIPADSKMSESQRQLNTFGKGLMEGLFEQLGTGQITKSMIGTIKGVGKEEGKQILKNQYLTAAKEALKPYFPLTAPIQEALTEAATQLSQNVIDKYTDPDKEGIDVMDNVADAGIVGGVMGAGFGAAPSIPATIQMVKNKQAAADVEDKLQAIDNDIDNDQVPDETKNVLLSQRSELLNQANNLIDQDQQEYNSLSEEQKGQIKELTHQQEQVQRALSNENITPQTAELLQHRLSLIQTQLNDIKPEKGKTTENISQEPEINTNISNQTPEGEIKEVEPNAIENRIIEESNIGEHQNRNESGTTPEAGNRNQSVESGQEPQEITANSEAEKEGTTINEQNNESEIRKRGEIQSSGEGSSEIGGEESSSSSRIGRDQEVREGENGGNGSQRPEEKIDEIENPESLTSQENGGNSNPPTPVTEQTEGEPKKVSGIKKSLVPQEKIESTEIEKKTNKQALERGKQLVDSGEINPKAIINEVNRQPRALQSDEVSSLVYYKATLDKQFDKTLDKIEKYTKEGDADKETLARVEMEGLQKELDEYYDMSLKTAYEQSLAFRLRQMLLDSEYTLQSQVKRYKAINKGEISPEVMEKFREYDKQIKELNKRLEDIEESRSQQEGADVMGIIEEDVKKEYKKGKKSVLTEAEQKRKKELSNKYRNKLNDITSFAALVADKEFYEYSGLVFKETAGEFNEFAKEMIKTVGKGIKEHLPELYKKLGGKEETIFEQEKPVMKDGKLIVPKNLIRGLVASGYDTIETLTTELTDRVKKDVPDITEREVRDAITEYGKTINMSKEDLDVKVREVKRLGRLISGLEDVQKKKRPLKSGLQRDKLTQEERRLQKLIKEGLKDIPVSEEETQKQWKTALDAVKSRLNNQIEDLERQLETGEKPVKKEGIKYDEQAEQLRQRRDELKQIVEDIEGKPERSEEQRLRQAVTTVERNIAEYQRRIDQKDFSQRKNPNPVQSQQLEELKAKQKELKDIYKEMEREAGVAEEKRLETYKKGLNKSIKEYQRRIDQKDYSVKPKSIKPVLDQEAKELEKQKRLIKEKFDVEMEKAKRANRELSERIKEGAVDVLNLPKSLMASADFSAPLRQGAILSFANPKAASKATVEMFRQAFSQKKADEFMANLDSSDKFPLMAQSKLYLSKPTAKLSAKEEAFISNIAHRIPVWGRIVKGSERAYTAYLNKLRADIFASVSDRMIKEGYDPNVDIKPFRDLAKFINNASGRGDLGALESSAAALNAGFFSPRYVVSRFNLLNPVNYIKMDPMVRKEALRTVLTYVGIGSTILALAAAAGADVDLDPESPDFGKIRIGDTRFDIWAGMQQTVRFIIRFVKSMEEITTGEEPDKNPLEIGGNFARGKLSPTASFAVDAMLGKTINYEDTRRGNELLERVTGKDIPYSQEAIERAFPLYLADFEEIRKDEGLPAAIGASIPSMFGVGVQHYE